MNTGFERVCENGGGRIPPRKLNDASVTHRAARLALYRGAAVAPWITLSRTSGLRGPSRSDGIKVPEVNGRGDLSSVSRQLKRDEFLEHFANRQSCLISMECCGGSQHWVTKVRRTP